MRWLRVAVLISVVLVAMGWRPVAAAGVEGEACPDTVEGGGLTGYLLGEDLVKRFWLQASWVYGYPAIELVSAMGYYRLSDGTTLLISCLAPVAH